MFLLIFDDILRYLLISLLSTFTYGTFELLIFTWYCTPSSKINFSWSSTLSNITFPLATEESIEIFLYVLFDSFTTPSTKSSLVIVRSVTTISGSSGITGSLGLFGFSGTTGLLGSVGFSGTTGLLGLFGFSGITGLLGLFGFSEILGLLVLVEEPELFLLLDTPDVDELLSPVCVWSTSSLLLTGSFEFPALLLVLLPLTFVESFSLESF